LGVAVSGIESRLPLRGGANKRSQREWSRVDAPVKPDHHDVGVSY